MPKTKLIEQGLLQMRGVDPVTWARFDAYYAMKKAAARQEAMQAGKKPETFGKAKALKFLLDVARVPYPDDIYPTPAHSTRDGGDSR